MSVFSCLSQIDTRYLDFNASIIHPKRDSIFYAPCVLNTTIKIINNGPDKIIPGDSIWIEKMSLNTLKLAFDRYRLNQTIEKGDSFYFNLPVEIKDSANNQFYGISYRLHLYNFKDSLKQNTLNRGAKHRVHPSVYTHTYLQQRLYNVEMPNTRLIDLTTRLLHPKAGDTIQSPGRLNCTMSIINLGPDDLKEYDIIQPWWEIKATSSWYAPIQVGRVVKPGDSIIVNQDFILREYDDTLITDKWQICSYFKNLYSSIKMDTIRKPYNIMYNNDKSCINTFYIGIPKPLSINYNSTDISSIKIFPNPSNGSLKLENTLLEIKDIKIYDSMGKSIDFKWNKNGNEIELIKSHSGIYFISISSNKGIVNQKLIVH